MTSRSGNRPKLTGVGVARAFDVVFNRQASGAVSAPTILRTFADSRRIAFGALETKQGDPVNTWALGPNAVGENTVAASSDSGAGRAPRARAATGKATDGAAAASTADLDFSILEEVTLLRPTGGKVVIVFCARASVFQTNKVCPVAVVGADRIGPRPSHGGTTVDVVRISKTASILSGIKIEIIHRTLGLGTHDLAGMLVDEVVGRVGGRIFREVCCGELK